jgi:hypothetical protein
LSLPPTNGRGSGDTIEGVALKSKTTAKEQVQANRYSAEIAGRKCPFKFETDADQIASTKKAKTGVIRQR